MNTPAPIKNHPNATLAFFSSVGLGSGVVWAVQHWFGYTLSPQSGLYIAGGLATVALFIGRNGLAGVKNLIMHGTGGKS